MKKYRPSPLIAGLIALSMDAYMGADERRKSNERPCLHCGKPKVHNNSFCSADCCRAYREARK